MSEFTSVTAIVTINNVPSDMKDKPYIVAVVSNDPDEFDQINYAGAYDSLYEAQDRVQELNDSSPVNTAFVTINNVRIK